MEEPNQQNEVAEDNIKKPSRSKKVIIEGINSPLISSAPKINSDNKTETKEKLAPTRLLMRDVRNSREPSTTKWWLLLGVFFIWGAIGWWLWYHAVFQQDMAIVPVSTSHPTPTPTELPSLPPTTATTSTSSLPTNLNATSTPATTTSTSSTTLTISNSDTGYVNIRSQPSLSGSVISKAHPGEAYFYTQTQNGWYQINLPNNKSGWVNGQYVTASH